MRLRAGIGGIVLTLGGCAGLPQEVRLDVDGRSIEVRQRGLDAPRWALDPECREPVAPGGKRSRSVGEGQAEVVGPDGVPVLLFRCR